MVWEALILLAGIWLAHMSVGAVSPLLQRTADRLTRELEVGIDYRCVCGSQEGHMPGDPHECRLNADRCSELAKTAATPELRQAFIASGGGVERISCRTGNRSGVARHVD
jgi:hypothetical protein